jgi:hypothetical protein
MIPTSRATITLSDGVTSTTLDCEDGEFRWFTDRTEPPVVIPASVSMSYSATWTTSPEMGGLFSAAFGPPATVPVDVDYTLRFAGNPDPGYLRRWARTVSSTPWRRRSLADWRRLWRDRMAGRTHTLHIGSVRFEAVEGGVRLTGRSE